MPCAPVAADPPLQRIEESTQHPILDWKQIEGKDRLSAQCCAPVATVSSARLAVQRYSFEIADAAALLCGKRIGWLAP